MATKTWGVSLDHSVADTDTGANWGNSADQHHPIGLWSGWTYRTFIKFTNDWTSVKRITSAELRLRSTGQIHVAFGTSPRMYIQRVTGTFNTSTGGAEASWTSSADPVYPGPTRTSTNQKDTGTLTTSENTYDYVDVTILVEDMAPTNVQKRNLTFGSGATNNGLAFISYDATTTSRTWEFYTANSSYDPIITLTYETTWILKQYAQALAQISTIQVISVYAQSETTVKRTYRGYGLSQSKILITKFGQSRVVIVLKGISYAQSQARIKATYKNTAQAQATILLLKLGLSQAAISIPTLIFPSEDMATGQWVGVI